MQDDDHKDMMVAAPTQSTTVKELKLSALTKTKAKEPPKKYTDRYITDEQYNDLCMETTQRVLENQKYEKLQYQQFFNKTARWQSHSKILNSVGMKSEQRRK